MSSVEQQTPATTNGASHSGGTIAVENPATGEIIGTVPDLDAAAVSELVARARAAQPGWAELGFEGRARIMRRVQKWMLDNADRVTETIVAETGKPYEDAQTAEIGYVVQALGFWAKKAPEYLADERIRASSPFLKGKKMLLRYHPLGVIGVIGPWNYPLANSVGDCIPALMAGNSVVLKPSEVTPNSSILMAEAFRECGLPEDVFIVATGRGETGAAMIDDVDFVMFTGSTATGRKVMERAAKTLTPLSLELGGKDPMIVLADANIERAANVAVFYGMFNAGQTCISVERVYVEEPVYDEFVAKVTEKVRALRQGESAGPGSVEIGSMIFPPQLEKVEQHVSEAVASGARALTGGKRRAGRGIFYEPTVLVDVDHSMTCMRDETFGPTLPIMKIRDAEEGIKLANDSPYGLSASVFTQDTARGEAIARRIDAGTVCVNDAVISYVGLEAPMGGAKESGVGTRHGKGGIRKYCGQQTILITPKLALSRELHMYPYKASTTRMLGKVMRLIYGRGRRD